MKVTGLHSGKRREFAHLSSAHCLVLTVFNSYVSLFDITLAHQSRHWIKGVTMTQ